MQAKTVDESLTTSTEIVLPNDANSLGFLRGGRLLHWMDIVSVITAQRHAKTEAVTISVHWATFSESINVGGVVSLEAKITRAFQTSMEIKVEAWGENIPAEEKGRINSAYFIFVGIDKNGEPIRIPGLQPRTEEEQKDYEHAGRRRVMRLLEEGRIECHHAIESLKNCEQQQANKRSMQKK